jgi:hypothetical protein
MEENNSEKAFCAIRKGGNGREWMDLSTLSLLWEETDRKARKTERCISGWAANQEIVRIAEVYVYETTD